MKFKGRCSAFKNLFPRSPLCAVNEIARTPILLELTFEQMAQPETFPANMVVCHESQSKKEVYLPLAGSLFCKEEVQSHENR